MKASLAGRIAIVTGAGRGIGRAIGIDLVERGATVIGISRTAEALMETVALASGKAGRFVALPGDVAEEAEVRRCIAAAEAEGPLDILINNAGIGDPAPLLEIDLADWERQMAVNARATFLFTREAARVMMPRGRGDIVNLISLAGKRPAPGFSAYTASKFAAVGFTEAVSRELRKGGIRVISLCPGAVATDLRRKAAPGEDATRITQPEQVAALIGFLLTAGNGMKDLSLDLY